jgi:hypothetical protein
LLSSYAISTSFNIDNCCHFHHRNVIDIRVSCARI